MSTTTWRKEFEVERLHRDDDSPVVAVAPDEATLDIEFDDGYGRCEGPAVLIWTEQRVYFPIVYDGAEWLGSAPRNPQPEGQSHVGNE
jgi:hypothetical protein